MDLEDLKKAVLDFAGERDWGQFHNPKNLAMAVSIEAGELLEVFQWLTFDEALRLDERQQLQAEEEIGDVMICLANLAARLNIDIMAATSRKLERNRSKYPIEKAKGNARKYSADGEPS